MKKPSKKLTDLIAKINAIFGIGYKVNVKQDDGSILQWTMKAPASMLGGHTPVIWTNEHASCYAADRVQLPTGNKIILKITFEDNGQDFTYFRVSFDDSFSLGKVIEAGPFQNEIWSKYYVVSWKPKIGDCLKISLSPQDEVIQLRHKIESIEVETEEAKPKTRKPRIQPKYYPKPF